jgi:predicted permease
VVGEAFFDAMGIQLLAGRKFDQRDTEKSQKVAIISETMARRFFPGSSPLGRHFGIAGPESANRIEIVGVVKDAKYVRLTEEFRPMAYYPHAQLPQPLNNLVVRFTGPSASTAQQLQQAIKQVNLPVDEVVALSDYIDRSLVQQKLIAKLASFFGLLALVLSCIGLYGVMSYAVAQRTNEIGIRMALGAKRKGVLWLVMREVIKLVALGLVIGFLASLAGTRTAATLLFGLKPNDPLTIAAASVLLLAVSMLAGYLPARRAALVDPMVALRDE